MQTEALVGLIVAVVIVGIILVGFAVGLKYLGRGEAEKAIERGNQIYMNSDEHKHAEDFHNDLYGDKWKPRPLPRWSGGPPAVVAPRAYEPSGFYDPGRG